MLQVMRGGGGGGGGGVPCGVCVDSESAFNHYNKPLEGNIKGITKGIGVCVCGGGGSSSALVS
jgi:hypothetical protein